MVKNFKKIERLKSFLIHIFGNENGMKRFLSIVRSNSLKVYQFKYGKENGKIRYDKLIETCKYKGTLPSYIERYGEVDGPKKYYEKNSKLSVSVNSLKKNGFTDDDIKIIKDKHRNGSKTDKASMIKKYGFVEGEKRYVQKMKNHFTHWNYKSVMKKYNIDEDSAKLYVKQAQIRDLSYFVEKYGKDDGLIRYEDANKKRAYSNTKDYYIKKYGDLVGLEKYKQVMLDRGKTGRLSYYIEKYGNDIGRKIYSDVIQKRISYFPNISSNIEIKFNSNLYNLLDDIYKPFFYGAPITEKPYYLNVNSELYGVKCVVPDVKIKNIIVEFDGEYWHSLDMVKERDELKNKIYSDHSYFLIRIKEREYIENSIKVLNDTIGLIRENIQI